MTLTESKLRAILRCLPKLTIGVVGDFFLDKYLDLDARLTERSIETGMDAYQVVGVRVSPGAGGTVTNNLAALGVGRIVAITALGDDGEGFELRRELKRRRVDVTHVLISEERRTPTYTKPMLGSGRRPARELNRLDIKNRSRLPRSLETKLLQSLEKCFPKLDGLIVLDQVQEPDCGVITRAVRRRLAELGRRYPEVPILADSRARIGLFCNVILKPNRNECLAAVGGRNVQAALMVLAQRSGRTVFCTLGAKGIFVANDRDGEIVPAMRVRGPIDIVGAGDSTTTGIVCALAAGATPLEAATLGNLVASITIKQIGTTGTANSRQVLQRFRSSGR